MIPVLAFAISLIGVLKFLFVIGVVALLIVGIKWFAEKVGWMIPEPIWTIVGVLLLLALLIYMLAGNVVTVG
jgi:hypothetical protein